MGISASTPNLRGQSRGADWGSSGARGGGQLVPSPIKKSKLKTVGGQRPGTGGGHRTSTRSNKSHDGGKGHLATDPSREKEREIHSKLKQSLKASMSQVRVCTATLVTDSLPGFYRSLNSHSTIHHRLPSICRQS